MAKITGPLLSMGASGQIGRSQVYSRWKGRPYVRQHVIPANPKSAEQSKTRGVFTFLNDLWRTAPADFQAPWTAFAQGKVLTNRNAFLGKNIAFLRPKGEVELDTLEGMFLSPGAKGGLSFPITIATGGGAAGTMSVTASDPAPLPAGWSVVAMVAAAILEQDPQAPSSAAVKVMTDLASPWSITLTGLTPGQSYAVGGWFVFQRSANVLDLAYGPAVAALVNAHA